VAIITLKSVVIDMQDVKYVEFYKKMARDRWYSLATVLSDVDYIKIRDLAELAKFPSVPSLREYFHRWGNEMANKYGKLPYCRMNTHKYDKFMEMK
jgi:hypothetical protein